MSVVQLTEMVNKLNQFIAPVGESSPTPFHPGVDADEQSLSRFVVAYPGAVRYCIDKAVGHNRLAVAFDGGAQEFV